MTKASIGELASLKENRQDTPAQTEQQLHNPHQIPLTFASGSSRDSRFSHSVAMMLSYWLG